jgi:hypothetical protein
MKTQKLSLEALKERAESVATNELLESISGGVENACHDDSPDSNFSQVVGFYRLMYHAIKYSTGNGW